MSKRLALGGSCTHVLWLMGHSLGSYPFDAIKIVKGIDRKAYTNYSFALHAFLLVFVAWKLFDACINMIRE